MPLAGLYKQRPGWERALPPYGRGSADMEPLSSYYPPSPGSHSYNTGIGPGPRPQATLISFPSTNFTQTPSTYVELFFFMRREPRSLTCTQVRDSSASVPHTRRPGHPWLGAQGARGGAENRPRGQWKLREANTVGWFSPFLGVCT